MTRTCCIPNCKKTLIRGHLFPKNETRKEQWLKAINCENFKPRPLDKICFRHFRESDYVANFAIGVGERKKLKEDAVPNIFEWEIAAKRIEKIKKKLNICKVDPDSHSDAEEESLGLDEYSEEVNDLIKVVSTLEVEKESATESNSTCLNQEKEVKLQNTIDEENEILCQDIPGVEIEVDAVTDDHQFKSAETSENNCDPQQNEFDYIHEKCIETIQMSIYMYRNDPKAVNFYTGLECFEKFLFVFTTLGPAVNELTYVYGLHPTKQIDPLNQFFLTLVKLRQNKCYYELGLMFKIPLKSVQSIFITWVRFMYLQWSEIDQWPSKDLVNFFCPRDFKRKFPNVRTIIDGTEIPVEGVSKPSAQQSIFSFYKNKPTIKDLVAMSPGGLISYLSSAYGGSATDRQIIERSDLLEKLDPGDAVLADKGFDIEDILAAYGVVLNIPTFFKRKNQITPNTLKKDRKIASKRVHIERLIGLTKTYKILKGTLSSSEVFLADEIIFVCTMLCNFKNNIVSQDA